MSSKILSPELNQDLVILCQKWKLAKIIIIASEEDGECFIHGIGRGIQNAEEVKLCIKNLMDKLDIKPLDESRN